MPRTTPTQAKRQSERQIRHIADEFRVAHATTGLSIPEIARRAGVAPSTVRRVEAGAIGISVVTLASVLAAVGLDLVLQAYPGGGMQLRDARHAEIAELLMSFVSPRLRSIAEVSAGDHGQSADLVLVGADEVIHLEIERRLIDLQAQLRSALRKREFLASSYRRPTRLVLVIEDTVQNRQRLAAHQSFVRSQLPAKSREVIRSIRSGEPLGRDGLLWFRRRSARRRRGRNTA
jgi:transcriptional regulator with XRE-family HTH domain